MTKKPTEPAQPQTIVERYQEMRKLLSYDDPAFTCAVLTAAEAIVDRLDGIMGRLQMIEEAVLERTTFEVVDEDGDRVPGVPLVFP